MATKNIVLEGKYKDQKIVGRGVLQIYLPVGSAAINKQSVKSYTVIDESNKDQYSFWKGALGVALLGGIGAVAGLRGKKNKEYLVALEWKDGDKSLISIDENNYKVLVANMF